MYLAQPGSGSGGLRVGQGCTPQAPIIPMSVLASLPGPAGVHPYSAFPGSLHLAQPAPAASLEEVVCGQPSAVLLRQCGGVTVSRTGSCTGPGTSGAAPATTAHCAQGENTHRLQAAGQQIQHDLHSYLQTSN